MQIYCLIVSYAMRKYNLKKNGSSKNLWPEAEGTLPFRHESVINLLTLFKKAIKYIYQYVVLYMVTVVNPHCILRRCFSHFVIINNTQLLTYLWLSLSTATPLIR